MNGIICVHKLNESFMKIETTIDIATELSDTFSFKVPGCNFMLNYKMGRWDGYIRLFNLGNRTLPVGLFDKLKEFADQRTYDLSVKKTQYGEPGESAGISLQETENYITGLGLDDHPRQIEIRDYQITGVHVALNNYRCILHSATGSGKSLLLGVICRYQTEVLNGKTLIVVPTVGLTTQMKGDFVDYFQHTGWSGDENIQLISAGADKKIIKPITISTFQSIYKFDAEWFNQFNCIIADEGHKVTAATIGGIFTKATKVKYKMACTGTVHDVKCNLLNMIGLTGPVHDIALTKDLIKNKQLVPLRIKALVLNYPSDICKAMKKVDYDAEIKYIVTNEKRNNFISKLATTCTGTTLVLYRFVDLQGQLLYNKILERTAGTRPVYFIDASVKGSEREMMRLSANKISDVVIEFEDLSLTCEHSAKIPLINCSEYKLASNITVDDDIDLEKIINNNLITGVNIRWRTI